MNFFLRKLKAFRTPFLLILNIIAKCAHRQMLLPSLPGPTGGEFMKSNTSPWDIGKNNIEHRLKWTGVGQTNETVKKNCSKGVARRWLVKEAILNNLIFSFQK